MTIVAGVQDFLRMRKLASAQFVLLVSVVMLFGASLAVCASDGNLVLDSEILRHRVEVFVVPFEEEQTENATTVIFKTQAWQALLLEEGVFIGEKEWASALDLLKTVTFSSPLFRVINNAFLPQITGTDASGKLSEASMVLLARFGVSSKGKRIFLYLIDGRSGKTISVQDKVAPTMELAIRKAVTELEETIALMPWRCRVLSGTEGAFIIERGELDGISRGQKFVGYAIAPDAAMDSVRDLELLTLQFGKRKGIYVVDEVGLEYSRLTPVDNAPMLAQGDVLELPAIRFQQRERNTRGKRVWREIYK